MTSKANPASPSSRPRRAAAENALYKPCPTCERKFLVTEIEIHANLCIQKLERKTGKDSPSPKKYAHTTPKTEESPRTTYRRETVGIYFTFFFRLPFTFVFKFGHRILRSLFSTRNT